jgi:hypothetical protein
MFETESREEANQEIDWQNVSVCSYLFIRMEDKIVI